MEITGSDARQAQIPGVSPDLWASLRLLNTSTRRSAGASARDGVALGAADYGMQERRRGLN